MIQEIATVRTDGAGDMGDSGIGCGLAAALRYAEAGLAVVPMHFVGAKGHCSCWRGGDCKHAGKHPATDHGFADATSDPTAVRTMFAAAGGEGYGVGVAGGVVSGNLVWLDFDGDAEVYFPRWRDTVAPDLYDRLPVTRTGKGYRVAFRVEGEEWSSDQMLARGPASEAEKKGLLLIELLARGKGGIAAPSTHPSGRRYEDLQLDLTRIPTLTRVEADSLVTAARSFNQYIPPKTEERAKRERGGQNATVQSEFQRIGEVDWEALWGALDAYALTDLIPELWPNGPNGMSGYVTVECPDCGRFEAYVYPPGEGGRGAKIRCNRLDRCAFEQTVFDYLVEREGGDTQRALSLLCAAVCSPISVPVLPEIQGNGRQLRGLVQDVLNVLVATNEPPTLFVRDGRIVRVRHTKEGAARIEAQDEWGLRNRATASADFYTVSVRQTKEGPVETRTPSLPPLDAIRAILALNSPPAGLPLLRGIVKAPVVSHSGVLETGAGYLPDTQVYHVTPNGELNLALPEPSETAVEIAKVRLFDHLLAGFPFCDAASRAHTLAALLLPIVRPMIDGPTPLHLIDAPTRASGKSLLAETIGAFTNPDDLMPTAAPTDEGEWRKKITAALNGGTSHIWFDNIEGHLKSESLCIALTATSWTDRLLGESREVRLPVRCTWLATSNNAQLHEDLVTRSVLIRLDPGVERPEERKGFAVPNPPTEVRRNRGVWLDDALILVRHWLSKGAPRYAGSGVSRFGEWSAIMGGLLESVGVEGFLTNYGQLTATASPEVEAWRAFVSAWADRYGTGKVTVGAALYPLAFGEGSADGEDGGASLDGPLSEFLSADHRNKRIARLGKALKTKRDRVFAGWKLRSEGGATTKHWLERAVTDADTAVAGNPMSPMPQPLISGGCAERHGNGGVGVLGVVSATHDLQEENHEFHTIMDAPVRDGITPTTPTPPQRRNPPTYPLPLRAVSSPQERGSSAYVGLRRGTSWANEPDWDGTADPSAFDEEGNLLPWDYEPSGGYKKEVGISNDTRQRS